MPKITDFNTDIIIQENSITSQTLIDKPEGTITLFAFDARQGLSEHSAPFDAFVNIVEGNMDITIGGEKFTLTEKQSIIMPADIPHALQARAKTKMLLVMIKK